MRQLKQREHKVHQKSDMLVPLAKWKTARKNKPWLHPTFNSALAVTIDERLDGDADMKKQALIVLLELSSFEDALYDIPEYTALLQTQLLKTTANFGYWLRWLKMEENIEKQLERQQEAQQKPTAVLSLLQKFYTSKQKQD